MLERIALGLLSFFPLAIFGWQTAFVFSANFATEDLTVRSVVLLTAAVVIVLLWLLYGARIYQNTNMSTREKLAWIVGLVFLSVISLPLFWYFFVFRPEGRTES